MGYILEHNSVKYVRFSKKGDKSPPFIIQILLIVDLLIDWICTGEITKIIRAVDCKIFYFP